MLNPYLLLRCVCEDAKECSNFGVNLSKGNPACSVSCCICAMLNLVNLATRNRRVMLCFAPPPLLCIQVELLGKLLDLGTATLPTLTFCAPDDKREV